MDARQQLIREEIAEERYLRSHPDPSKCHCRGRGWWNTNYDTWETCSYHYTGQDNPEWAPDPTPEEVEYAEKVDKLRKGEYAFPPPPVPTALWGEKDWIAFIDREGRWL